MLLIACSTPLTKIEYIYPEIPVSPAYPEYYSVIWSKDADKYCFDESNAKNLLKNFELIKSSDKEMRKILESLRRE